MRRVGAAAVALLVGTALAACSSASPAADYSACRNLALARYEGFDASVSEVSRFGDAEALSRDDFINTVSDILMGEHTIAIWRLDNSLTELPADWVITERDRIRPKTQEAIDALVPAGADPKTVDYVDVIVTGPNNDTSTVFDEWLCVDTGNEGGALVALMHHGVGGSDETVNAITDAVYPGYATNDEWRK
jgi:hypothetical protein